MSVKNIVKEAGLATISCGKCGHKMKTDGAFVAFWKLMLSKLVNGEAERITLPGLGTLGVRVLEGRTVTSPPLPGGEQSFGDRRVLRFRQSTVAKAALNPNSTKSKKAAAAKKATAKKAPAKKATAKKVAAKKSATKKKATKKAK